MKLRLHALLASTLFVCALTTQDLAAQDLAEQTYQALSPKQRAGQLFVSWILSRADETEQAKVEGWVRDAELGGVIISLGSTEQAAALVTRFQNASTIPLLISSDFEAGVGTRLTGGTALGSNMLIGAAGLERLARAAGHVTGTEARALGVDWTFAPVLDVNVNPRNPIINVRSFGERPALVASLGSAFVLGLQATGSLATGKHFPGHGDVSTDSHLALPSVPGDRARLERIELLPFRTAVHRGLRSIMTGHLSVPGLGEEPGTPATLSQKILTGLLREEMGFDGLIVTDALEMGGIREKLPPAEVAIRALLAGADVLLMPPEPVAARDAVAAAVASGRVPAARLQSAVMRILRHKERLGLLANGGGPAATWRETVSAPKHIEVAQEIAERGLTLVKDDKGLIPIAAGKRVLISLLDKADTKRGQHLAAGIPNAQHLRLHPESDASAVEQAAKAAKGADLLIVAMHVKVRAFSGEIGLPETFKPVLDALRAHPKAIAVSLGNPYLVLDFPNISTYICTYADTEWTQKAAARALLGHAPITGRLPVSIPGVSQVGDGLSFLPPTTLERSAPETEGMPQSLHQKITTILKGAVATRVFPGAVAMITRRGRVVAELAYGTETYAADAPAIQLDSRFDLASVTKVCATTPAILTLIRDGRLRLNQKVQELVPSFQGEGKDKITIRHLLTHTSGLPAYVRFFRSMKGKTEIIEAAAREGLRTEPGKSYRYSDLGLILLMACVEKVTGDSFDRYCAEAIYKPLGMTKTGFTVTGEPIDAVPTEITEFHGGVARGQVHDENANAMGGTSGHAGLFSTAEDVTKLGLAFLGGGRGWLPSPLVRLATTRANAIPGSSRALGWDTFTRGGSGGSLLSPQAFGHTGFTGTSIWCDPARDLTVVLLTNRVHPTRVNAKIMAIRRAIADLAAKH